MKKILKKIFVIFLLLLVITPPLRAKENKKIISQITQDFKVSEVPDYIVLKSMDAINVNVYVNIPPNSYVKAEVLEAQEERRWHKSGYILCKLLNYTQEDTNETVDISEQNIYLFVRKHDVLNKKAAAILTTELVVTQAASIVGSCFIFFAPVDIAYFFTKGAIQRKKHPNWFKAGVHNAYDNSIFWFCLKGKPINLSENDTVKLQPVDEKKAVKSQFKIIKRKTKYFAKKEIKKMKKEIRQNRKDAKDILADDDN